MNQEAISILKKGGVGILPTDTIYGLVGSAFSESAVSRIYELKGRDKDKPLIILISEISDLEKFGVKIGGNTRDILKKYWPGKVSIILPCDKKEFEYLHRGANSLAFRLTDKADLISLIKQTGPIVAPSANLQNLEPAKNIEEAKEYFGDNVDFYIDGNELISEPSTLIKIENDEVVILRKGSVSLQ